MTTMMVTANDDAKFVEAARQSGQGYCCRVARKNTVWSMAHHPSSIGGCVIVVDPVSGPSPRILQTSQRPRLLDHQLLKLPNRWNSLKTEGEYDGFPTQS